MVPVHELGRSQEMPLHRQRTFDLADLAIQQ